MTHPTLQLHRLPNGAYIRPEKVVSVTAHDARQGAYGKPDQAPRVRVTLLNREVVIIDCDTAATAQQSADKIAQEINIALRTAAPPARAHDALDRLNYELKAERMKGSNHGHFEGEF